MMVENQPAQRFCQSAGLAAALRLPSMVELAAEPLMAVQRKWLTDNDVPERFIDSDWRGWPSALMQAKVAFSPDGHWFDHDPRGETAVVFPLRGYFGDQIDWGAWQPETDRFATCEQKLAVIGLENVLRPRLGDGLTVHKTLLNWLRNGRVGVIIRDLTQATEILRDAGRLKFESASQARQVREQSIIKDILVLKGRDVL
jgi:hypothetical protein